jgi:hypothetical protein
MATFIPTPERAEGAWALESLFSIFVLLEIQSKTMITPRPAAMYRNGNHWSVPWAQLHMTLRLSQFSAPRSTE